MCCESLLIRDVVRSTGVCVLGHFSAQLLDLQMNMALGWPVKQPSCLTVNTYYIYLSM